MQYAGYSSHSWPGTLVLLVYVRVIGPMLRALVELVIRPGQPSTALGRTHMRELRHA